MNYCHLNSNNLLRLNIPYSISCRQRKKCWLIWHQSLIFIFILPQLEQLWSAVFTFLVVKYFLWRKQGWQAPHIHLLIHFPLKREKKKSIEFSTDLSNLSWNNELNNWHQFIVTVQFFFLFKAMWVFSVKQPFKKFDYTASNGVCCFFLSKIIE